VRSENIVSSCHFHFIDMKATLDRIEDGIAVLLIRNDESIQIFLIKIVLCRESFGNKTGQNFLIIF
jgi:hypothetical protein